MLNINWTNYCTFTDLLSTIVTHSIFTLIGWFIITRQMMQCKHWTHDAINEHTVVTSRNGVENLLLLDGRSIATNSLTHYYGDFSIDRTKQCGDCAVQDAIIHRLCTTPLIYLNFVNKVPSHQWFISFHKLAENYGHSVGEKAVQLVLTLKLEL